MHASDNRPPVSPDPGTGRAGEGTSLALLEAAFEAINDAVCLLDLEGRVLRCNRAMGRLLGQDVERVLHQPCYRVFHRLSRPVAGCPVEKMKMSLKRETLTLRSGERYLLVVADPVLDAAGDLMGAVHVITDITRRKRAEAALKRVSARLLQAQEEERKRIAWELHDGIGQSLSAIKFSLESALTEVDSGTVESMKKLLTPVVPMVRDAIEEVRRIGRNLRPSILDDLGILPTLRWLCREFSTLFPNLRVHHRLEVAEEAVAEELKIHIFRILQEALNNIAKHSGADRVEVTLRGRPDSLELVIADNGRGFVQGDTRSLVESPQGMGLSTMKERTVLSGGSFTITSTPGRGTEIRATWPLNNPASPFAGAGAPNVGGDHGKAS